MPTRALARWQSERITLLDEAEKECREIRQTSPDAKQALAQSISAWVVLIGSQFREFCRDLHTECADIISGTIGLAEIQRLTLFQFLSVRKLDQGISFPAIQSDFDRFQISVPDAVDALGNVYAPRRLAVQELLVCRQYVCNQTFPPSMYRLGKPSIRQAQVEVSRKAADRLADAFDEVMVAHLRKLLEVPTLAPSPGGKNPPSPASKFAVGAKVEIRNRPAFVGEVIEERGAIGRQGRNFVSVRLDRPEPVILDFPEEELDSPASAKGS